VRLTRVYVEAPLAPQARIKLTGSAAAHVIRVLRLRVGDALIVFNGQGGEYAAGIHAVHDDAVTVVVGEQHRTERESPLAITLAQGISRGERMDLVVQKATELGVARLIPVLTERSVVRLDGVQAQRKLAHWQAIAVAACEQSARTHVPQIDTPLTLAALLRGEALALPAPGAGAGRLLLSPTGEQRVQDLAGPLTTVSVLIGPEGGLTPAEIDEALAARFAAVRLGPRVLRTETAAIAALALLQQRFGDL
jgi:16S rRNA (uracil1498-N3)-methyltransferase